MDAMGICYAHIHGKGKITKNDLVDYWSHAVHGREMPDATNPAYRALLGVGPEVDDSPKYWQSAGAYAWKDSLAVLQNDDTVPERYKTTSAKTLSNILIAVHTKKAVECLKFLDADDQKAVFIDVMKHSKVGSSKYARSKILQDLDGARTYAAKIDVLVTLYGLEHGPQFAKPVIEELICRCAWAVVTRVMGYRTGEIVSMETAQTLESSRIKSDLPGFEDLLARAQKVLSAESEAEAEARAADEVAELQGERMRVS